MSERILLVEDDESIGSSLTEALAAQGQSVRWVRCGADALEVAAVDEGFDVVLLDLGLPDIDGLQVCRRLRADHPEQALIVLTARDAEVDIVLGLDAGADDYITKPFSLAELLARLRAQRRRQEQRRGTGPLRCGDLVVDGAARRALVGEVELELSPKEFDLLALLVSNAERVVTRERIIDVVWDEHWFGSTKTLDMHIVGLRRKLAAAGDASPRITTLRRVGYRLDA